MMSKAGIQHLDKDSTMSLAKILCGATSGFTETTELILSCCSWSGDMAAADNIEDVALGCKRLDTLNDKFKIIPVLQGRGFGAMLEIAKDHVGRRAASREIRLFLFMAHSIHDVITMTNCSP